MAQWDSFLLDALKMYVAVNNSVKPVHIYACELLYTASSMQVFIVYLHAVSIVLLVS